ncbi:hypothetical protein JOC77_000911 [Peribacillus deserti]|uniref:Ornithine monooxygenase n=1 Tax=Peribacillus deserti TaxID=673318 RepID=A0ABS2QEB5_9BACI|nr:VOC family protein [Peribacillus deserti]MBM7691506.1 hypothetical protein [Peribacillus deserti]
MYCEMTIQVRVADFSKGHQWYETLLNKKADLIPHDGFAEWELLPGCWLQVAEGISSVGSGPIRLCVRNIEDERNRLMDLLDVPEFAIHSRKEVPVKWGTFTDPWGNRLGFFEYIKSEEKDAQINKVIGKDCP